MNNALLPILRKDFRTFFIKCFAELHDGELPELGIYIAVVIQILEEFCAGTHRRLILNLPPRHLKTFLGTICTAAWLLAHHPAMRIMVITYGEDLSRDIADKIRRILRSDWFCEAFVTRLSADRFQVTDFTTKQGGAVLAKSFGGPITGRGADAIVIDDAVKIADALNLSAHDRAAGIFQGEVMNRLNVPKTGRILIVGHRLHPEDLSGRLIDRPGWNSLVLPFIADSDTEIIYGNKRWSRKAGELLRPDAYAEDDIEGLRSLSGPAGFDALFQQNPTGMPWSRLSDDDFPAFAEAIPFRAPVIVSVDPAQKAHQRASFSVIQAWSKIGENLVLTAQWRGQVDYDRLKIELRQFVKRQLPNVVLIESTNTGKALAESLRGRRQCQVIGIDPGSKSKIERLGQCVHVIKDRKVFLKWNAEFRDEFVEEFEQFPYGEFDDQVDATTQVLNYLAGAPLLPGRKERAVVIPPSQFGRSIPVTQVSGSGGRALAVLGKHPRW